MAFKISQVIRNTTVTGCAVYGEGRESRKDRGSFSGGTVYNREVLVSTVVVKVTQSASYLVSHQIQTHFTRLRATVTPLKTA